MENTNTTQAPAKKRNPIFLIILILLVIGGGWFGYTKYKHAQYFEETDDAQVSADISPVIPRVGGYITEVKVKDNQMVKKGDTLVILDDRDYVIRLQQAEAALHLAITNKTSAQQVTQASVANIGTAKASIGTADAQIEAARVNVWRTTEDYKRYDNLIKDHSITQQQYEQALAAMQSAQKQLAILQEQKKQASEQTQAVAAQSNATASQVGVANATIEQRNVDVEAAKLNLSYTVITAPQDGRVSKVQVHAGQLVQPGQSMFSIVEDDDVWVIANFKETQLQKMASGQKVAVRVDAFPKHEFDAIITSFSPATGSTFSLLPADNASGNFVKVVQRLPVKIEFINKTDTLLKKLRPGMSADVNVSIK